MPVMRFPPQRKRFAALYGRWSQKPKWGDRVNISEIGFHAAFGADAAWTPGAKSVDGEDS